MVTNTLDCYGGTTYEGRDIPLAWQIEFCRLLTEVTWALIRGA